ncbi:MAG: hypothetical protein ACMXYE_03350 [Candidatus Woesearchaeota archaeon]
MPSARVSKETLSNAAEIIRSRYGIRKKDMELYLGVVSPDHYYSAGEAEVEGKKFLSRIASLGDLESLTAQAFIEVVKSPKPSKLQDFENILSGLRVTASLIQETPALKRIQSQIKSGEDCYVEYARAHNIEIPSDENNRPPIPPNKEVFASHNFIAFAQLSFRVPAIVAHYAGETSHVLDRIVENIRDLNESGRKVGVQEYVRHVVDLAQKNPIITDARPPISIDDALKSDPDYLLRCMELFFCNADYLTRNQDHIVSIENYRLIDDLKSPKHVSNLLNLFICKDTTGFEVTNILVPALKEFQDHRINSGLFLPFVYKSESYDDVVRNMAVLNFLGNELPFARALFANAKNKGTLTHLGAGMRRIAVQYKDDADALAPVIEFYEKMVLQKRHPALGILLDNDDWTSHERREDIERIAEHHSLGMEILSDYFSYISDLPAHAQSALDIGMQTLEKQKQQSSSLALKQLRNIETPARITSPSDLKRFLNGSSSKSKSTSVSSSRINPYSEIYKSNPQLRDDIDEVRKALSPFDRESLILRAYSAYTTHFSRFLSHMRSLSETSYLPVLVNNPKLMRTYFNRLSTEPESLDAVISELSADEAKKNGNTLSYLQEKLNPQDESKELSSSLTIPQSDSKTSGEEESKYSLSFKKVYVVSKNFTTEHVDRMRVLYPDTNFILRDPTTKKDLNLGDCNGSLILYDKSGMGSHAAGDRIVEQWKSADDAVLEPFINKGPAFEILKKYATKR